MPLGTAIFVFILGISIGSFLNVVILRLGSESVRGRSRCPHCGKILSWYELLPLLSFVLQLGRCRGCKKQISLQYPVVEFLTGLFFLLIFYRLIFWFPGGNFSAELFLRGGAPWLWGFLLIWWYYVSALVVISVYDIRRYLIPDAVLIPAIFVSAAAAVLQHLAGAIGVRFFPASGITFLGPEGMLLGRAPYAALGSGITAAIAATALLGCLHYFSRGRAMGFGDVKLGIFLGLILGWPDILVGLMLGFIFGSIASIIMILAGRKHMKSLIPFGPFLALGAVTAMLAGDILIRAYFRIIPNLFL